MENFIKTAIATPKIDVAMPLKNAKKTLKLVNQLKEGTEFVLFPELNISGYSCGDLFFQSQLILEVKEAIKYILENNKFEGILIIGAPLNVKGLLFNTAVVIKKNEILGIIPKHYLPNNYEFTEKRYFNSGFDVTNINQVELFNENIPFGNILFENKINNMIFGVEICEDLWAPISPSSYMSLNGCEMIFNLSASPEHVGKKEMRENIVSNQSLKNLTGYAYAASGTGESTGECVFATHNVIAECGDIILNSSDLKETILYEDIDLSKIRYKRRKTTSLKTAMFKEESKYTIVKFDMKSTTKEVEENFNKHPFKLNDEKLETTIDLNVRGLIRRIEYLNMKNVVIGLSGGLDSTYALLVAIKTFDKLNIDRKNIICFTMPSFATSSRTYNNALKITNFYGVTLKEINIKENTEINLKALTHKSREDIVYENTQARIRTSLLMNAANKYNAIVIGTADLSEIALGFSTYNADNMSMYAVNAGLPKTTIRELVRYVGKNELGINEVLIDIVKTPISPELKEGQETENIIGNYEINDFILYRFLICGDDFKRIHNLVIFLFGKQNKEYVSRFFKRFFASQYKRQIMPEGANVLNISLSSNYSFRMPSDIRMDVE